MGSNMLSYEERRDGLLLRLEVTEQAMLAKASRAGRVLATGRCSHGGALGPDEFEVHASPLAKALMRQAADKALGRLRRNPFDLLVDQLYAELVRRRKPIHLLLK